MKSLTKEKRYDMIDAFNSTSRYLYSKSIIFTLNRWFTEYIPLNYNLTKLLFLIQKQLFRLKLINS